MDLLEQIKTTLQKSKVEQLAQIAANGSISVKKLIELSFHQDEQIGFRAAWILERVYSNHIEKFIPQTEYFFEQFAQQNNLSARRHFAKILAFITDKKANQTIKNIINNYDTTNLVETVFAWLIDEKTPVAIKSHCLNILANLIHKHDWIKSELSETMDYLVDKESIAFFAKVKQIRKQLKKL
jgi:hypothetical protein